MARGKDGTVGTMQFSIHCDSRRVVAEEMSGCGPSLVAWSISGEMVSHLQKAISLLSHGRARQRWLGSLKQQTRADSHYWEGDGAARLLIYSPAHTPWQSLVKKTEMTLAPQQKESSLPISLLNC